MAIVQCIPDSMLLAFTSKTMDFAAGADVFYVALYDNTASLGTSTTAYTATGEVTGTGYTAGGILLQQNVTPVVSSNQVLFDWQDETTAALTLNSAVVGAMIYNSTVSNAAVAILKFTTPLTVTAGKALNLVFPGVTTTSAVMRLRQVS